MFYCITLMLELINHFFKTENISYSSPLANIEIHDLQPEEAKRSILERYWEEDIIITKGTKLKALKQRSKKYNAFLKRIKKKKKKRPLKSRIKKALNSGHIEINFDKMSSSPKQQELILCKWKKPLNIIINDKLKPMLRKLKLENSNDSKYLQFLDNLSRTPIFVVKNNFHEIVGAYPNGELKKNVLNHLNSRQTSKGFGGLFVGYSDALDLKKSLNHRYPYSSQQIGSEVSAITLKDAYLLNQSGTKLDCYFVADFSEIIALLNRYKYNPNLTFHPNQKYGKNYFEGQPLYRIEPFRVRQNGKTKKIIFSSSESGQELLFTSFETLNKNWQNFRKKNADVIMNKRPKVIVYNLECFLSDYETNIHNQTKEFLIVPNHTAIEAINTYMQENMDRNTLQALVYQIKPQLTFTKKWVQRLFTCMTTRKYPEQIVSSFKD
uniref:hypothetical protein n=1 Tax=Erythrolobus coxiae TaxID=362235 RepID=UPI001FCD5024|nr:hypothetical protein MW556_pgp036 [Erythrolobus coxiae]UNJ17771.1 hypothetical protein [Erythrolobus coxiae]